MQAPNTNEALIGMAPIRKPPQNAAKTRANFTTNSKPQRNARGAARERQHPEKRRGGHKKKQAQTPNNNIFFAQTETDP